MDTSKKIIRGVVNSRGFTITSPITQWDYGWQFIPEIDDLPATYRLDFSNEEKHGTALPVYCSTDGAEVPTELIDTGKDVWVWFVRIGDGYGITEYEWRVPNKCKPKTEQDEPTPSQQSSIDQLIVRSNDAVESAEQSASDASQSAQSASQSAESAEQSAQTARGWAESAEDYAQGAEQSELQASASALASAQSASASAQIKTDVESMVDDAQASADASERSASNAHTYATSAERSSVNASASETSAQGYASQAQTSAQTASSKASEASASAQTASTKASESAQSASQALTYKTDAESAKTASQAAQGLAEQAKADAITAKTGAESARDDAQNLVDGISGKVEQIDQNTADIASLEEDRYKPYVVDSASGSIASFPDGADDIPLKSCIVQVEPVQEGSGDPSPDNVRPITGWTGAKVTRCGKNFLNPAKYGWQTRTFNGITYTVLSDGSVRAVGTSTAAGGPGLTSRFQLPAGTYYGNSSTGSGLSVLYRYAMQETGGATYPMNNPLVSDGTQWFYINLYCSAANLTVDTVLYPQIELGTTFTGYEPYQGTTYPITFPSEAGTVYGGTLDVTKGELVVDRAMVDLGTLKWQYNTTYAFFTTNSLTDRKTGVVNLISDLFKTEAGSWSGTPKANAIWGNESNHTVYVQYPITSVEDFMTLITGHQLCYELAKPIEIQLSANQINSLLGVNNIWADSGDTEAEYRANTKLYIEKLTQPEEDDMIANSAIASGQFFMIGNSLYRALANIARGATITVGTNAQRVSLSDALNLVNA